MNQARTVYRLMTRAGMVGYTDLDQMITDWPTRERGRIPRHQSAISRLARPLLMRGAPGDGAPARAER